MAAEVLEVDPNAEAEIGNVKRVALLGRMANDRGRMAAALQVGTA